jgi:hypothetical protein
MVQLIRDIQKRWPDAKRVVGHKDLVATECPGLPKGGVAKWWAAQNVRAPDPAEQPFNRGVNDALTLSPLRRFLALLFGGRK